MDFGFIITEGYHELEVNGRLLKRREFKRITQISELNPYWKMNNFIPTSFPIDGDLMKRIPCPVFFENNNYSVALQSAGGINQIKTIIDRDNFSSDVVGIGILIDADFGNGGAIGQFNNLKRELESLIKFPDSPGKVLKKQPNTGIFVFPDNVNEGTLENILLKCAEQTYPDIYNGANDFVSNINIDILDQDDKKDFTAPAGKNKSIVGGALEML